MNVELAQDPIINYEELVHNYTESLTTVLRNFKPAVDFLETWVHDEDPVKSILNIIESAAEARVKNVTLLLGAKTLKMLNLKKIEELAKSFGKVQIIQGNSGLYFQVLFYER